MTKRTADAAVARHIIESNVYMTIGTADAAGVPWANPVYFTAHRYREMYWVSRPDSRHSQNIAARPEVALVVFDSQVRPGDGQAVYMSARAAQVTEEPDIERGLEVYNFGRFEDPTAHGATVFTIQDLRAPHTLRLYRAVVSEHFVLEAEVDRRTPVDP